MLDTHIIDCPICKRIGRAAQEIHTAHMPSFDDVISGKLSADAWRNRLATMPSMEVRSQDLDHWLANWPEDGRNHMEFAGVPFVRAGSA